MSDNHKITVTLKGTGAYSDPWIVFYGDSVAEVQDTVSAAEASGLFVVVGQAAQAYATHANVGAVLGAKPVSAPVQGQSAPAAPAAPQAAPTGPPGAAAPTCPHGTKVYRTAKPPKTWKGWFCPSPQGTPDQCKPEFVN